MDKKDEFLRHAVMDADVFAMCVQHALSTEKEEIMGLLIGEVNEIHNVSYIRASMTLIRIDKRPDRVEISPEQIATASAYAEDLSRKIGKPCRVLGWYHSHPHITVWPSNIDVRTQAGYQMMDKFFVGLIFSVFQNGAKSLSNTVSICCFQSVKSGTSWDKRCIDLQIAPSGLKSYNLGECVRLPDLLYEEELKAHERQVTGETDNLTHVYNETVKTMELVNIMSHIANPLVTDLEQRLVVTKKRIAALEKLKSRLLVQNL